MKVTIPGWVVTGSVVDQESALARRRTSRRTSWMEASTHGHHSSSTSAALSRAATWSSLSSRISVMRISSRSSARCSSSLTCRSMACP
jgi:hypothetical protein